MPSETLTPITQLLQRWRAGDAAALDVLTPLVYGELRRVAGAYLRRERAGHGLQPKTSRGCARGVDGSYIRGVRKSCLTGSAFVA